MTLEEKIGLIRVIVNSPECFMPTEHLIREILDNGDMYYVTTSARFEKEKAIKVTIDFYENPNSKVEVTREDKKPREIMIGIDNKNAPIAIGNCNVAGLCDYLIGKNAFQTKEVIKVREVVE